MSMSVNDVVKGINWKLLREQKLTLINLVDRKVNSEPGLMGLVEFIDMIQDSAVNDGLAKESEVFKL
jgi:hypothetical protein